MTPFDFAVTGSRRGPTDRQAAALGDLLARLSARHESVVFRHGACKGVDALAAYMVRELWGRAVRIVALPQGDAGEAWVDDEALRLSDEVAAPVPARERNAEIAGVLRDLLVALPAGDETDPDQRRSGTWMAIRMRRQTARPLALVRPTGYLEQL